jgi:hypothetical protein
MAEQHLPGGSDPAARTAGLHAVAEALRKAHHLTPEARQALADLLDALSDPAVSAAASPADLARLTDGTAHLVRALQHKHDPGLVASAVEGLEQAVLRVESAVPVAGAFHRLLDALANIGI